MRLFRCLSARWRASCSPAIMLTMLLASVTALAGGSVRLPLNLDFGPGASPVYDVYDKVSGGTVLDGRYGWLKPVLFQERDRGGDDELTRDFIFAVEPAAFRIVLPNGDYLVTMTCIDTAASHPSFAVRAGDRPVYRTPELEAGVTASIELLGRAKNGVLDVEFIPLTDIWLVNAMTIRAYEPGETVRADRYSLSNATGLHALVEYPLQSPRTGKLKMVKKPNYDSPTYPDVHDYMRVLERFPLFAQRGWHPNYGGLADVGYFGDGDHDEMGLRSMGNFIFTCALLASDPAYDPRPTGVSRDRLLDYSRQCLRYMTRSHVTGDLTCGDGGKWGNQWQSSWWTGKMAAGAKLIWGHLTSEERAAVERVVTHEASRHLARSAPGGATSNTRSEENAWDTEALSAALALFPEHPNVPKWWRKLQDFSMNTLSAPQDRSDGRLVDRRPVSEWVYTENIHSDFTIENHGAYHFCYMACPLHSFAWGWYNLISNDRPVPQALFHHYTDVWNVIRRTFLYDGRFAYISSKDWPRYAYGLYFIMPACVLMQEVYGDREARLFEKQRFRAFEREQIMNADGTFYGRRFTANRMLSRPLEFETDTYANLGVCYLMHKMSRKSLLKPSDPGDFQKRAAGAMISKDSGWILGRSPKVFTSFSWRELGGPYPIGLFVPAGCDDMIEWGREQLSGSFDIEGCSPRERTVTHKDATFDGGFWTVGRVTHAKKGTPALSQDLAFVSLPDEGIAVFFDRAVALSDITVKSQEGLRFHLANDIFNSGKREVRTSTETFTLWGGCETARTPPGCARTLDSPWLTVDGKLSFVALTSNAPFVVRDIRGRAAAWGSLEYELIDLPYIAEPHDFRADGLVRYSVVLLAACDARRAADWSGHCRLVSSGIPNVQCAVVSKDGRKGRLVAVNFGERAERVRVEVVGETVSLDLPPMSADSIDWRRD